MLGVQRVTLVTLRRPGGLSTLGGMKRPKWTTKDDQQLLIRVEKALERAASLCYGDLDHYYYERNNRKAFKKLVSWRNRINAIIKSVEREYEIVVRFRLGETKAELARRKRS